jgi:hypothetical protein
MYHLSRCSHLYLLYIRLGLTKTGQGSRIEAIARGIPTLIVPGKATSQYNFKKLTKAITGGSEDVLLDLGVREAIKISNLAAKNAKL